MATATILLGPARGSRRGVAPARNQGNPGCLDISQGWKTPPKFLMLVTAMTIHNVLSFLPVSKYVIIFNILDSILKFSGKKFSLPTFFHLLGIDTDPGIRIGMPWMPIPIRKNDADSTQSGSTTLRIRTNKLISIANLQYFIFPISIKICLNFQYFVQLIKTFWKLSFIWN
jgi:hypothetical protein